MKFYTPKQIFNLITLLCGPGTRASAGGRGQVGVAHAPARAAGGEKLKKGGTICNQIIYSPVPQVAVAAAG